MAFAKQTGMTTKWLSACLWRKTNYDGYRNWQKTVRHTVSVDQSEQLVQRASDSNTPLFDCCLLALHTDTSTLISVRGENSAKEQDSSVGGGAGNVCLGVVHMEEEVQDRVQVEHGKRRARYGRDTRKGTRRGTEREQTINQQHIMDDHEYGVMRTNTILRKCSVMCVNYEACTVWEKWRVTYSCLHSPSVTVDRHRL